MSERTDPSLVAYLEASARRYPDRTAVVDPDGSSLTYQELDERADRIAGFLVARGVRPGDRVGVVVPKGAAAVTAFFGIMKARAAYVPADYTAPISRNRLILSDCQVSAAFLAPRLAGALEDWTEDRPRTVVIIGEHPSEGVAGRAGTDVYSWDEAMRHAPVHVPDAGSPSDLAYILYTSGSTGVPKGVMLTHDNARSFVDWCSDVFEPAATDRFSSHAPFHFDLSILDIYVAIKHGAAVHVISEEVGKSPQLLAEFIESRRLTVWYSTPSILAVLAQFGGLASRDCRSLRLVLFAGEVFPVKHLRDLVSQWPWPAYFNLYGPTETNVCTFARIPTPIPEDRTQPYPIGMPCSHCDAMLMDEAGRPVERTGEGLLYIAGASVFAGYWNRNELNTKAFTEYEGRRFYNTGDVVTWDPADGFIYRGRRDRMVKRRGYRIELGEIERGLYQHPSVAEAAVIGLPDDAMGVRIIACIAFAGTPATIVDMKMFCARQLLSYMVPDVFQFYPALPRTSTDKIDYQALTRASTARAEPAPG